VGLLGDTFSLLRNRDFRFLMGAQWLAQAGDGLVIAAVAKFITFGGQAGFDVEAARSPTEAFRIVLFTFLPLLVLSPFLGVLIDRWDRRRLLIGSAGLRAVVLLVVAGIGGSDLAGIGNGPLYLVLLLTLASTRLLLAIKGAAIPATLGERHLIQGNSVSQAGSALFQLGGAGMALVAAGLVDVRLIVVAGAIVYLAAMGFAWGTRTLGYPRKVVPLTEELGRMLRDVGEGLGEVRRRPRASLALVSFLAVRSLATLTALTVSFASLDFVADRGAVGTVVPGGAGAVGAVLGFLVANLLRERVAPGRIVATGIALGGAGMTAFGGIITFTGISVVAFAVGLSFFLGKIGVDTLTQQGLSDAFRGRGFSFQDAIYNLSWILPSLVLVLLFARLGPRSLLLGAGLLFVAIAVGLWGWAGRVGRDRTPAHTAAG
jgi:hypothetical protein